MLTLSFYYFQLFYKLFLTEIDVKKTEFPSQSKFVNYYFLESRQMRFQPDFF